MPEKLKSYSAPVSAVGDIQRQKGKRQKAHGGGDSKARNTNASHAAHLYAWLSPLSSRAEKSDVVFLDLFAQHTQLWPELSTIFVEAIFVASEWSQSELASEKARPRGRLMCSSNAFASQPDGPGFRDPTSMDSTSLHRKHVPQTGLLV